MAQDSVSLFREIQKAAKGAFPNLALMMAISLVRTQNATVPPNLIGDEFLNAILFILRRKLGEFDVGFYGVLKAPLAEVARDNRLSSHVLSSSGYGVVMAGENGHGRRGVPAPDDIAYC